MYYREVVSHIVSGNYKFRNKTHSLCDYHLGGHKRTKQTHNTLRAARTKISLRHKNVYSYSLTC